MKTWAMRNGCRVVRLMSGRCNVFALLWDNRFLLVDTGRKNRRKSLMRKLDALLTQGYQFTAVVLTHTHFDHAENAAAVQAKYRVPVYAGQEEMECLARGVNPPIRGLMGLMKALMRLISIDDVVRFGYDPVPDARPLENDDNHNFLAFPGVTVVSAPGHTPGSICIIADDVTIAGDTMHGAFPGNAWPPFGDNAAELLSTWRKLLDTGCSRFLPSHGWERRRELVERQYLKMLKFHTSQSVSCP